MDQHLKEWEVVMPEKGVSGMSPSQTKRAELLIWQEDQAPESISLPVAVGRTLKLQQREGLAFDTRSHLLAFVRELQKSCAKDRMLSLLERRDHSKAEVERRLRTDGYPSFARAHAVEVGERYGFLSDERFTTAYATAKLARGWGLRRIEFELSRKGVDTSRIAGWPDDFVEAEEEYSRALDLAKRKRVSEPNAYAKLARFLLGRGYSYSTAKKAAKEALG